MISERDKELLAMNHITSYFPIEFSNGAAWEELDGECKSCKKTIPRTMVRGLVSRPFPNVAVVDAVGVRDECKLLTRYHFRLYDNMSITGLIQSDLYRLEACIENALDEHDANISKKVMGWVKEFGFVSKDYLTEFVFMKCREFVFSGTTLKARLKKLPSILSSLFPQGVDYKAFENELQELATAQNSHPQDFHDWTEWPKFKW